MKILTIHPSGSGASRLIPLYVLEKRYISRIHSIKNSFLVPKTYHEQLINSGINILDIDNSVDHSKITEILDKGNLGNSSEVKEMGLKLKKNIHHAIYSYLPDVVIEDLEPYSVVPCKELGIPRISFHRTGQFRSIRPEARNPNHIHSCEKSTLDNKKYDASAILGNSKSKKHNNKEDYNLLNEYPDSDAKIIPGIPSIEMLPDNITNRDSYFYSGPLLVEDNPTTKITDDLKTFFTNNIKRKIVFITTGLVDNTSIEEFITILLRKGYALITTVKTPVPDDAVDRVFINKFLPLNLICSNVNLVIHQCGSGIYNYPILNNVASITIGTRCYDREDVALRLEELGISKHIPHPEDNPNYLEIFKQSIELFENNKLCDYKVMEKLRTEMYNTMLEFDITQVIDYATNKCKKTK